MKLKLILFCTYLSLVAINAKAQMPTSWTVNPNAFNYNMTVTSKANVACVELANTNNAIAAFVGGQCRGVVNTSTTVGASQLAQMLVYSNVVSGEKVNYKIYNSVNNTVYDVLDSIVFANNAIVGGLITPVVMYTNHAPTAMSITNTTINENTPIATVVGNLSATDIDAGTTFTYTLASGVLDNNLFAISGNKLLARYKANYDVKNSYRIRVRTTDSFGLYFEKTFTVTVKDINPNDIKLPSTNYISPNDDGKNDFWVVQDVHSYATFTLQIMDQFGQIVYSVDANYNNEFDGKFDGKALPTGTYYYVFKNDTKTFKGNITIGN